ncbi:FAD:protein FMN transferase [Alloscardovia theropitheci]|uniref:FAD:protein FMN transferase n=1 Tax=Alloscardovia theropitheci TaxID=2496842 RepID=A0A4R0QPM9_9BIFI|nr:FAD:protein FMN transferase [Alloscardovia theropitheci]TCD54183.1 FAD:protein FMN transferase [Alloscardovia theropitheci]
MTLLFEFPKALGTGIIISSSSESDEANPSRATELRTRLKHIIDDFDTSFSRFRADSLISRIARGDFDGFSENEECGEYDTARHEKHLAHTSHAFFVDFPPYASHLFDIYDALFSITNGRFTPAVADDLIRLGYGIDWADCASFSNTDNAHVDAERTRLAPAPFEHAPSLRAPSLRAQWGKAQWGRTQWGTNVFRLQDCANRLYFLQPVHLDFGAAGKGFLIDLLAQELSASNLQKFTINAGGDLYTTEHLHVAMENPWNLNQAVGVIDLPAHSSLCASAPSRRHWTVMNTAQEVHHLIDATTGRPTQNVKATWVSVANSSAHIQFPTAWADALSTALFLCEPQDLINVDIASTPHQAHFGSVWQYARLMSNKEAQQSIDWPGNFFIQ